jgi:hypothetical protein
MIEAISSTTFDPAGITAPLVPLTGESTVATILSPGRLVSVQTRPPEVMTIPVPDPISREGAAAADVAGVDEGIGANGCGRGVASRGACAGVNRSRRAVRVGVGILAGDDARTGAALGLSAVS